MDRDIRILPAGDRALVVEFGNSIDPLTNRRVLNLYFAVKNHRPAGVMEMVPTYRSLLLYYDPLQISFHELQSFIRDLSLADMPLPPPLLFKVPVLYGGEYGPDLEHVARCHGLSEAVVVELHTRPLYRIYMLGFTPGFCYLGGLPKAIATPRLEKPRLLVPAGSVGIAGDQTGIYPVDSPGGWQIIGRTPLRLFNPGSGRPFLFSAGNYLRFVSIAAEEFRELKIRCDTGNYCPETEEMPDERD